MNGWRGDVEMSELFGLASRCCMPFALAGRCRYAFLVLPALSMRAAMPVEFAPGVVSTGHEFTVTFSPDAREVYFTRSSTAPRGTHIMRSTHGATGWQPAEAAPFSSDSWADLDPAVSP